jgi:hypothetical protein
MEKIASHGRVDSEAGVIYDVVLIGQRSTNGRRYSEAALKNGVELYRGVLVHLGHADAEEIECDRDFSEWLGVIERPRYQDGAIRGDIRLRRENPHYKEIIEAAEAFGDFFGCSHVAEGRGVLNDRIEVVHHIDKVHSVDLCTFPASTNGLFQTHPDERLSEV